MRTLVVTALMMVATMAWAADEPKAPDAKPAATAPAPAASQPAASPPAASQPAASDTATAAVAPKDEKPFTPPPGYRPKRINGEQVYCAKIVVLGSRFPKEDCRTEYDLRQLALRKDEMRRDVEATRSMCASDNGGCGMH